MKVFITGTDTGIGKTEFSCALIRFLCADKQSVVGIKPIESGVGGDSQDISDAIRLSQSGGHEPLCLYELALAASPWVAAEEEGVRLDINKIISWIESKAIGVDSVVCEGAGGWCVPITESETIADLAHALGWPVIVVARDKLGTVNHTLLSVDAIKKRGLATAVVFNHEDEVNSYEQSLTQITSYLDVPVWTFTKSAPENFSYSKFLDWANHFQP